jgi:hypothetical protein
MMTVDQALQAMAAIDGQRDGTEARAVLVAALNQKLLTDPEHFWDFYWEAVNRARSNHFRDLVERLLRSGSVDETTTLEEIPAILCWDAAGPEGQQ